MGAFGVALPIVGGLGASAGLVGMVAPMSRGGRYLIRKVVLGDQFPTKLHEFTPEHMRNLSMIGGGVIAVSLIVPLLVKLGMYMVPFRTMKNAFHKAFNVATAASGVLIGLAGLGCYLYVKPDGSEFGTIMGDAAYSMVKAIGQQASLIK